MSKKKSALPRALQLLKLVVKQIAYFEKNPSHLAWAMMHYAALIQLARRQADDYMNPKDPLLEIEGVTKDQADLIYDAWGATVSNGPEFCDQLGAAEQKPFKTIEDWVALCTSPTYKYQSIYPNKRSVYSHFLCCIGTGIKWVEDNGISYLADVGPSGKNQCLFYGYTICEKEVDPAIRAAVSKISNWPECSKYIAECIENGSKTGQGWEWEKVDGSSDKWELVPPGETKLDKLLRDIVARGGKPKSLKLPKKRHTYYPLCENYSPLCTMPANAHASYKKAAKQIAKEIIANPEERATSIKLAKVFLKQQA